VLGFNEISNIVLARAAVKSFKPMLKTYEKELEVFWEHAFICALAARIIGEHINQPSGHFFIAGLLHDIGKLAMLLAFKENYDISRWLLGFSTAAKLKEEKKVFSTTHDVIGARLLQRWHFPDALVAALRYHHAPLAPSKFPIHSLIVKLADFLSFMYVQPVIQDETTLKIELRNHLPNFEEQWHKQKLPWEEVTLESYFAWLKVDHANGSGIIAILAS